MFCSDATADAGEPLLGSASRGHRHVLLSQPKGAWAEKALQAPALRPIAHWAAEFDRNQVGKTVVRLFAPPEGFEGVEIRLFPLGRRVRVASFEHVPDTLDRVLKEETSASPADPCPRTLAVCTHGKHDRCCAKHGQALFTALRDLAREAAFDVVESTHLGGHRFAGTCLDLRPDSPGRMYGRLQREEALPLFRHLADERVWLARYRGRCDLDSGGQIAEAQALALGARGWVSVEALEDAQWQARWEGGETVARLEKTSFTSPGACGDVPTARTRFVLAKA
ncbi:MAG: sucrase ferredoxin [Myxococcota bacterium]